MVNDIQLIDGSTTVDIYSAKVIEDWNVNIPTAQLPSTTEGLPENLVFPFNRTTWSVTIQGHLIWDGTTSPLTHTKNLRDFAKVSGRVLTLKWRGIDEDGSIGDLAFPSDASYGCVIRRLVITDVTDKPIVKTGGSFNDDYFRPGDIVYDVTIQLIIGKIST